LPAAYAASRRPCNGSKLFNGGSNACCACAKIRQAFVSTALVVIALFCYLLPRMKLAEHIFGSPATELKLSVVEAYLRAYTTALRGKFPELWYIDAFAGTGERTEIIPARREGLFRQQSAIITRRGSAKIALDVAPPFAKLIFVEKRRQAVKALCALRDEQPGRDIQVIGGDANVEIPKLIKFVNWRRIRAVMFLDPYGMNVGWETLEAIAKTRAIDVWFLFSLSGLYRQAARSASAIDEKKRAAITRVLGTDDWERELYTASPRGLFPNEAPRLRRTADVGRLQDYVRARLKMIFPVVLPPLPLPPHQRPQKFSLFFAISNDEGPAIGLATRIASHILKSGMSSRSSPR
jgi:three-Cys-motif partner protein